MCIPGFVAVTDSITFSLQLNSCHAVSWCMPHAKDGLETKKTCGPSISDLASSHQHVLRNRMIVSCLLMGLRCIHQVRSHNETIHALTMGKISGQSAGRWRWLSPRHSNVNNLLLYQGEQCGSCDEVPAVESLTHAKEITSERPQSPVLTPSPSSTVGHSAREPSVPEQRAPAWRIGMRRASRLKSVCNTAR